MVVTLGHLGHPGMGVPGVCALVVGIVQEPWGILVLAVPVARPCGCFPSPLQMSAGTELHGASGSALHLVLPARKAIRASKVTTNLILNYQVAASQTLL